jgi:hypothetical protein
MYIDKIVFSSASDTTTVNVGFGNVLGLKYKTLSIIKEYADDVELPQSPDMVRVPFSIDTTAYQAATVVPAIAPYTGKIKAMGVAFSGEHEGGADTIAASIEGTAVSGLNVVATSVTGTLYADLTDTIDGAGATHSVEAGDVLQMNGTGNATAGAIESYLEIDVDNPYNGTFIAGDETTVSATTGDTRGTYTPKTAPDGSTAYKLLSEPDRSALHGIEHYFA